MTIHRVKVFATIFQSLKQTRTTWVLKKSGNVKFPADINLFDPDIKELFNKPEATINDKVLRRVPTIRALGYTSMYALKFLHVEFCIATHGLNSCEYLLDDNGRYLNAFDLANHITRIATQLPPHCALTELTVKLDCCFSAAGNEKSLATKLSSYLRDNIDKHIIINIRASLTGIRISEVDSKVYSGYLSRYNKAFVNSYKELSLYVYDTIQNRNGTYAIFKFRQIDTRKYILKQFQKIKLLFNFISYHPVTFGPTIKQMLELINSIKTESDYGVQDAALIYIQKNHYMILQESKKITYHRYDMNTNEVMDNIFQRILQSRPWAPQREEYVCMPSIKKVI